MFFLASNKFEIQKYHFLRIYPVQKDTNKVAKTPFYHNPEVCCTHVLASIDHFIWIHHRQEEELKKKTYLSYTKLLSSLILDFQMRIFINSCCCTNTKLSLLFLLHERVVVVALVAVEWIYMKVVYISSGNGCCQQPNKHVSYTNALSLPHWKHSCLLILKYTCKP